MAIKRIRLEAWVDDNHDRGTQRSVMALHVDREKEALGLRHVWFIMDDKELRRLTNGEYCSLEDGYHMLRNYGDFCTFFDLEIPRDECGIMQIPYLRMNLPKVFWKYLERLSRAIWRGLRKTDQENKNDRYYYSGRRIEIEIPLETLSRFQARYGRGLGQIDRQYSERLLLELGTRPEKLVQDNPNYNRRSLHDCVRQVEQIARNATGSVYKTARCSITNDWDGYYFKVPGLVGGICNHARDANDRPDPNGNDWSIHT